MHQQEVVLKQQQKNIDAQQLAADTRTDKSLPVQKQQSPSTVGEFWVFKVLPGDGDGGKERVEGSWKDGTGNVFGSGTGNTSQHQHQQSSALELSPSLGVFNQQFHRVWWVWWVPVPITPEQQPQHHSEVSRREGK